VVVQDPPSLDRALRGRHDRVPEPGVRLHDRELLVGERARLLQDGIGDADLADVVQQAGQAQPADVAGAHAQLLTDQPTQLGDGLAVAVGVGVLGVDRARQCGGQRVGVALLGDLVGRGQRRLQRLVVEQAAAVAALCLDQRQVGAADQAVAAERRAGLGNAAAGRGRPRLGGGGHGGLQVLDEIERVDGAALVHDQRELVAADPVGAGAGAGLTQRGTDRSDALVPGLVAVGIVRLLEPVQVEQRQRQLGAGLGGVVEVALQVLLEGAVVAEAGQAVGECGALQPLQLALPDPLQPFAVSHGRRGRGQQQDAERDGEDGDGDHHTLAAARLREAGEGGSAVLPAGAVERFGHRVEQRLQPAIADGVDVADVVVGDVGGELREPGRRALVLVLDGGGHLQVVRRSERAHRRQRLVELRLCLVVLLLVNGIVAELVAAGGQILLGDRVAGVLKGVVDGGQALDVVDGLVRGARGPPGESGQRQDHRGSHGDGGAACGQYV
jgi:hypothetical protein